MIHNNYLLCFILLSCSLISNSVAGQTTFYRSIDVAGTPEYGTQLENFGDGFAIVSLQTCPYPPGAACTVWQLYDALGQEIFTKEFSNNEFSVLPSSAGSYFALDSLNHYLVLSVYSPTTDLDVGLIKFDPLTGDSIFTRIYEEEFFDIGEKLIKADDQNNLLLLGGRVLPGENRFTPWLIKITLEGNIIWERDLYHIEGSYQHLDHLRLPSNDYLVTYAMCPSPALCNRRPPYRFFATRLDTAGQEVWTRELPAASRDGWGGDNADLLLMDDSSIVFNWVQDLEIPWVDTFSYPPLIRWINEDGDSLRQYDFDNERFRYIKGMTKAANGDIIAAGFVELNDLDLGTGGWVFRMSPQGELRWQRYIADVRFPFNQHYFKDVVEAPDGGIVLTGLLQDSFPNYEPFINNPNIWLVKLDSTGCLEPDCGLFQIMGTTVVDTDQPVELPTEATLHLFPNPAKGFFQLRWLEDGPSPYPLAVEVFGTNGQRILQQTLSASPAIIDCAQWPPGIYIVRARSREGKVLLGKVVVE